MMLTLKKYWHEFKSQPWERRTLWTAAAVALLPILATFIMPWNQPSPTDPTSSHQLDDIATFIPQGFVLLPIEIQNYESLDSILGKFAIVDLFQTESTESNRQSLVARNVRLLRAPQNPTHFAVLVRESEVVQILRSSNEFTVVVKPPKAVGTEIVKEPMKREITYEGG